MSIELRSYLGILNYYHRFLKNLSTELAPLYELLHDNVKWTWEKAQQKAFEKSKELLKSATLLIHYNPELPLLLQCDASPVGVACVMSHIMPDKSDRPIMYASRSLNKAERNYSQLEREALSIVYGVKYFHKYIAGREFTIVTDYKPLLGLFNPNKQISHTSSMRIQKWCLMLGGYNYNIIHKSGKENLNADALSRLPQPTQKDHMLEPKEIVLMLEQMNSGPVSAKDVAKASRYDPTISKAMEFTLSGWPQFNTDPNLTPYFKRRNELSTEQGCLIWGQRVVVPSKFRDIVLEELHDCHPGIVKMKALCRSYVWWPGVDEDIQNTVRKCDSCQVQNSRTFTSPMYPWDWPSNPWRRLHVDYAGPIEGKMVLIIIDAHTKFIEAHIVNSATSANTIAKLRQTFATHGLPGDIVSDNGTPFKSELMAEFCEMNGIKQIFVSPYRPASNGLAERAVQSVKNGLRKAKNDQVTLETRLYRFLLHYNKVPQSTTGLPPCELLMKS